MKFGVGTLLLWTNYGVKTTKLNVFLVAVDVFSRVQTMKPKYAKDIL